MFILTKLKLLLTKSIKRFAKQTNRNLGEAKIYSQTTSKLKCVGSPCRIIYTVCGKPLVSLLKLFDYILQRFQPCFAFSYYLY